MSGRVKEFGGQAIIYGLGDTLYKAIAFFLLPVYLKYLTPVQYGIIEVLSVTSTLVVIVVGMGLPRSVFRFFYRSKDEHERKRVVSTIFFLALLSQIIVVAIFFWQREWISELLLKSPEYSIYFAIISATVFLSSFRLIPLSIYRARKKPIAYSVVNLSVALVVLLANIYFVVYAGKGVLGVVYGNLCGAVVGMAMVLPTLLREIQFIFDPQLVKKIFSFSIPLALSSIPLAVIFLADRYFLTYLTNFHELGLYALAYKLGSIIKVFIVAPFALAWTPFIFEHEKDSDAVAVYSRMATYFVMLGSAVVVAISILSVDLVAFLSSKPEYQAASSLVPVLCYAFLMFGIAFVARSGIVLSGLTYWTMVIMVVCLGVNLITNYVLISIFGVAGATYALLITFTVASVIAYAVSCKLHKLRFDILRISQTIGISVLIIFASHIFAPGYSLLDTGKRVLFVIIFLMHLYYFGLKKGEREKLVTVARSLIFRGR